MHTNPVWCCRIIVHSNRLFVLLSALELPGFFPPFEISPCLQWRLRTRRKRFSNWWRLSAQKSFANVSHYLQNMSSLVSAKSKLSLKVFSDSHGHLSLPLSPPLLCPVAFSCCSKALCSFNERSMGRWAVWGLLTGFVDWARQESHQNKQKLQKNPPTLFQPACALLIWIPREKVQVTESLLKQTSEKTIYLDFFCFKEGGKNRK